MDGPHVEENPVHCALSKNPYAQGEFRIAYMCRLRKFKYVTYLSKTLVAKESKHFGRASTMKQLYRQAHIQTVAAFMAKEWSKQVPKHPLRYVAVQLMRIPARPAERSCFSVEEYIGGEYRKFSNNNGYVDRALEAVHPALQAFSHFTYQYTRGLLMAPAWACSTGLNSGGALL